MTASVSSRYALRSLRRNLRRTLLSVIGVGFGVGVGLIAISWLLGTVSMIVDGTAASGVGHLRVAPAGWDERRSPDMRLSRFEAALERVRGMDDVAVAAPRATASGLLGMGTRSAHVELTGVDAEAEPKVRRYVRDVEEGRYLRPEERGAIVIGRAVADRLGAAVDDELVVTVVDDEGEMQSALLLVVGVVHTGSRAIDGSIAHVALEDVEQLSGREGAAEITILLEDSRALESTRARLESALGPLGLSTGDEVLSWLEVKPEMRQNLETRTAFMGMAIAVVLLVVLLGVASAQLTGVLERRKEFAVLAALGTRAGQLVRIVLTEGAVLGLVGGATALAWASPLIYRWATSGIDLVELTKSQDEGLAYAGVLFDRWFFPELGAWLVPVAFGLSLLATIVASLYPAWFAARTDPARALRVDR